MLLKRIKGSNCRAMSLRLNTQGQDQANAMNARVAPPTKMNASTAANEDTGQTTVVNDQVIEGMATDAEATQGACRQEGAEIDGTGVTVEADLETAETMDDPRS